jgi:hypothetical protein
MLNFSNSLPVATVGVQVIVGVQAIKRMLVITGCTVYCRGAAYIWGMQVIVRYRL